MTTLEQALHIFRKDARHLRFEIGAVFVFLIFLVLHCVQTWESIQEHGGPRNDDEGPISAFLIVAWSLLIARVIQTEALPGDRHFWLTRPYSRAGLLLAKGLFIGAFINIPFLIAQAAIITMDGLPLFSTLDGLLWNQLLITVLVLLPIAAVAALTRNLAQFLPAVILAAGAIVVPLTDHGSLRDMEWIRSTLGFVIAAAIVSFTLWRQYRLRRSGNTALLALGATFAGLVLYAAFPPTLAFAIQSRIIKARDSKFALRLAEPAPRKPETQTPNRYRQLLAFPIATTGADPRDLQIRPTGITIKTLAGITRRSSGRVELTNQKLVETTSIDREFFEAAKNSPVTVRAEFYVVQYGNARTTEVRLDGTPYYIPGLGQCGIAAGYDDRRFVCRAAFQNPKPFISERLQREGGPREAYSPFPAQLRIYPVIARTYNLNNKGPDEIAPAVPERPAVLLVRDPVAYFRYTLEAPNVRLADFAVAQPKGDDDGER